MKDKRKHRDDPEELFPWIPEPVSDESNYLALADPAPYKPLKALLLDRERGMTDRRRIPGLQRQGIGYRTITVISRTSRSESKSPIDRTPAVLVESERIELVLGNLSDREADYVPVHFSRGYRRDESTESYELLKMLLEIDERVRSARVEVENTIEDLTASLESAVARGEEADRLLEAMTEE